MTVGGGALAVLALIFATPPCQQNVWQSSAENGLAFATPAEQTPTPT